MSAATSNDGTCSYSWTSRIAPGALSEHWQWQSAHAKAASLGLHDRSSDPCECRQVPWVHLWFQMAVDCSGVGVRDQPAKAIFLGVFESDRRCLFFPVHD